MNGFTRWHLSIPDYALVMLIQAGLLVAVAVLREPKLLIPAVVFGLPFEYLQTEALGSLGEGGASGAVRAMLNPGKLAMVAVIGIAVLRARHNPAALFPNSAVLVPVLALAALTFLGVAWSDSQRPTNAVLILPIYVAFVFAAPGFIEDRRDVERIVAAFLIAAGLLSLVALAQQVPGVFRWRESLIGSGTWAYRSNATFSDPNNLARFLAISVALAGGLILATGPRRLTVYIAIPSLAICAPALFATGSRSGWVGVLLAAFVMVLLAPIPRYTRARLLGAGALAGVFMLALLLAQGGASADRVRTFTNLDSVLGQREFLIQAGWEMWKDNPFFGVGTGNFQHTLLTSYMWVLPWWAEVTLSHTSFITVLAEWGLVGVPLFGFVILRVGIAIRDARRAMPSAYSRLMLGWCAAALVEVLFQSQSEGRLFDEPYLWVLLALVAALELGAAERVPAPATVPAAATATEAARSEPARVPAGLAGRRPSRAGR